jgi:geranylgeranyl pyrophosphate synthase
MRRFGIQLGMAFQIVDDILDFTATSEELGKPAGSDLLSGTVTLPTLLYMGRSPEDNPVKRAFEGTRRRANLQRAINEIRASDLLDESMVTAQRFAQSARDALTALPEGEPKATLDALVDYVTERRN